MERIRQEEFGKTKDGKVVTKYTLTNKKGMKVSFLDYGAVICEIIVPDRNGEFKDVALGCSTVNGYETNLSSFGAFVGRCANRISNGTFTINGKEYQLMKNDHGNNLHGGEPFYNKLMYEAECLEGEDEVGVEFSRLSPDGEQGFPGNLDITVTYTLTDDNEILIEYLAVSDQDTVVNFTNHSYFNLAGHNAGTIFDHEVMICADAFTPTDEFLIPTGEIRSVEGTPLDFRKRKRVGDDIEADYEPIRYAKGYDHNFVLHQQDGEVEKVAEVYEPSSGRKMEVFTNFPGIQLYTSNGLEEDVDCKDGATYGHFNGLCLETQFFPNACNTEGFQSTVLKAGEEYDYQTVYKFSCE